ncbi:hypothetical protein CRE_03370 [Caenorhabditis remanei]|uniref:Uncharacterized protein n=1 Tax=Caenorhabditis remanei TaxID=31234 RepID=E3N667_CAERE|nr:hypothetical protein CRE_03370 [Caenorhabditis remanei]
MILWRNLGLHLLSFEYKDYFVTLRVVLELIYYAPFFMITKFHGKNRISLVEVHKFSGKVIVLTKKQTIRTSHLECIVRRNSLTKSTSGQQCEHTRDTSKNNCI